MFVYDVVGGEAEARETHMDNLAAAAGYGLPMNSHHSLCANIDEVIAACHAWIPGNGHAYCHCHPYPATTNSHSHDYEYT